MIHDSCSAETTCLTGGVTTSVRIFEEFGAIDDEAKRWRLLSEDTNSPMHQYAWVKKACSDAFAEGKLHLIVVGNDQPGALGPFIVRGRRLHRLECLGVDELYEPTDFPHSDPASLTCLVNTLVELRRPLLLRRILADSPVLTALRSAFRWRGVLMTRPVTGYPWIELDFLLARAGKEAEFQPALQPPTVPAEGRGNRNSQVRDPGPHTAGVAIAVDRESSGGSGELERTQRLRIAERYGPPEIL